MAEVSLDSVIGKITNATMPIGDLAKALEDVKLESKAGEEANRQLRDLIEKQSSMSAKERRASQKQLDDITKLIQNSSEIADSDKIKFQTLIKMHDQRIKSDSSLMKDVGSQLTEKITENVTNIGAVVSGVVSDSPLLAMGVKFLGDSVVKGVRSFRAFQKKNKEEKELRSRQTELFREQERIDEEERRAHKLSELVGENYGNRAQYALRYGLSSKNINSVVIGMATLEHLKNSIEAVEMGPLPASLLKDVSELQKSNFL